MKPKHWSQLNEKVLKQREDEPDNNFIAINGRLSLLKEKAEMSINDALRDEFVIPGAYLKNAIINPAGKQRKTKRSFFEVPDEYIESSKAIKANRPVVCYGTFKNFLMDFEKDTKYRVDLYSINHWRWRGPGIVFHRFRKNQNQLKSEETLNNC